MLEYRPPRFVKYLLNHLLHIKPDIYMRNPVDGRQNPEDHRVATCSDIVKLGQCLEDTLIQLKVGS